MNISKKHGNGRKSFLRLGACFTAAAVMGTIAVTASAEEVKNLVTAPFNISSTLGDGSFITKDGSFVYIDDDVL